MHLYSLIEVLCMFKYECVLIIIMTSKQKQFSTNVDKVILIYRLFLCVFILTLLGDKSSKRRTHLMLFICIILYYKHTILQFFFNYIEFFSQPKKSTFALLCHYFIFFHGAWIFGSTPNSWPAGRIWNTCWYSLLSGPECTSIYILLFNLTQVYQKKKPQKNHHDFVKSIHLCIKLLFTRNNLFLTVLLLNYISNIYAWNDTILYYYIA